MSSVTETVQQQTSSVIGSERGQLAQRISELGDWFHNLDLHGVPTAPHHFLGDFPSIKWRQIARAIPQDLAGATVLDVGCNGGFYSIEMKKRGAKRVVAIDVDDRYQTVAELGAALTLRRVPAGGGVTGIG
jgi:tRNA (mo5U34)-methyltransferase